MPLNKVLKLSNSGTKVARLDTATQLAIINMPGRLVVAIAPNGGLLGVYKFSKLPNNVGMYSILHMSI